MTAPWKELAVPFPADTVKQRPGRGNLTFSYVDARVVMQRLDDVLTPSGWDFTSTVIPGTDIVRGELTIGGVTRVDYGYPNSDHDEEPIKAASSDALKRCAVMFGIGRHLYDDNQSGGGRGSSSPARPPARIIQPDEPRGPRPVQALPTRGIPTASVPEEPADLFADRDEFAPIGVAQPGDLCDEHGVEWRGETGDLYHKKAEGGYCRHPGNTKKARRA